MYEFHWPTRTLFDPGLIEHLDEHIIPTEDAERLLIVAPGEAWVEPLLERISDQLTAAGWQEVEPYAEVEPNPSWKTVKRGVKRAQAMKADSVLAIGGGSAMDAGKVIAERGGAGFLCTVPTTAGTGGEISPWAVISNTETRQKDSVTAKWPDITLLDPKLTLSLPAKSTLFTGIDAFIHGLEAYMASAATPITDGLARKGMEMITANLQTAVENGDDLDARSALLQGSLLTGAAMLHSGLGLMHAIGNVTGGLYHELPHGLVLMRCMNAVLDFNMPVAGEKYEQIRPLVEEVRTQTETLFAELDVPEIKVAESDLPLLAKRAVENVNAKTNPRPASEEDVQALARQAFNVA